MVGTKAGGLKASKTNIEKYGSQQYVEMGRKGGRVRCLKGFAKNPELARSAGRIGGMHSSREGIKNGEGKKRRKVTLS